MAALPSLRAAAAGSVAASIQSGLQCTRLVVSRAVSRPGAGPSVVYTRRLSQASAVAEETESTTPFDIKAYHKQQTIATPGKRANNPHKAFVRGRIQNVLSNNILIGIFSFNGLDADEWFQLRRDMKDKGMNALVVPNKLFGKVVEGSRLEAACAWFTSPTVLVYTPNTDFKAVSALSKHPKLELLGAIVDGRAVDPKGLKAYENLGDIDTLRAQLLAVIQQPGQALVSSLQSNQQRLVYALSQIGKEEGGDESS